MCDDNEAEDIESILFEALKRSNAEQRDAYLTATCGVGTPLRHEIESLLKAYEVKDVLKAPSDRELGPTVPLSESPGTTIGNYKLLKKIGEGGMAVVYSAQQEQPIQRKVAIKIIKLGMDTKQVIGRFDMERQALALMDRDGVGQNQFIQFAEVIHDPATIEIDHQFADFH